jgi:hypothetical protein
MLVFHWYWKFSNEEVIDNVTRTGVASCTVRLESGEVIDR